MSRLTTLFFTMVGCFLVSCVFAAPGMPMPGMQSQAQACSADDHAAMPCVCCKKDCWYSVAAAATHELGHMPGEAGEQEAMATLKLIRICMMEECGQICMRRPF